jgi:hypothetical protein
MLRQLAPISRFLTLNSSFSIFVQCGKRSSRNRATAVGIMATRMPKKVNYG